MKLVIGDRAVTVNIPTQAALLDAVRARFRSREGFALATVNLDHLTKLPSDSEFASAYDAQDFVVADGNPIVWVSRLAGQPVDLLPGSDLVVPLTRLAAEEGITVGLVGSHDTALKDAERHLKTACKGVEIKVKISPEYGFDPDGDEAREILKKLESAGVGLCFLALGAPKQERFAARGRELAPNVGFASIGAGLDFFGGHQKRAPRWVRRIAMEWFWRMASNPKRLAKRYMLSFAILPGQVANALKQRRIG